MEIYKFLGLYTNNENIKMETIRLIKKFAPIFVFHSREKYFPVNLKTAEKEEFTETMCPENPLYYSVIYNEKNEMTVNFVLLFPQTYQGTFGITSILGDVKFIRMVIDTDKKTLKKIFYGNNLVQEFGLKTDRPRVYVSLDTHNFYPMNFTQKNIFGFVTEETEKGLSWETEETAVYQIKKLKDKKYGDSYLIPKNFYKFTF